MGTEATRGQSLNYGCIVEDKSTHSMLHYVEKPNSYISSIINCGVYLFALSIFDRLATVFETKQQDFYNNFNAGSSNHEAKEAMWLEKDIIMPLAGTNQVRVYTTTNWWSQIKTAGAAIYANRHYLKLYNMTNPLRLAANYNENGNGHAATKDLETKNDFIGDVYIHPSASIHPTAVVSTARFGSDELWNKMLKHLIHLCSCHSAKMHY